MQEIKLDQSGLALADTQMKPFVEAHMRRGLPIHVSNAATIDYIRAWLRRRPLAERPQIKWVFYGKEVHFDNDMKSFDAWENCRMTEYDDIMMELL